jgi:predicted enzyme related to lactoylglutathione lyase
MITGVSGASLWSQDNKNLVAFYRDVLGLKVMDGGTDGYTAFGNDYNGPWLGIGTHSEVRGKASDQFRHMVGLDSNDLKADYERLKAAGVEFIEPPTDYGGMLIATLKDPEGNLVQLFQAAG